MRHPHERNPCVSTGLVFIDIATGATRNVKGNNIINKNKTKTPTSTTRTTATKKHYDLPSTNNDSNHNNNNLPGLLVLETRLWNLMRNSLWSLCSASTSSCVILADLGHAISLRKNKMHTRTTPKPK